MGEAAFWALIPNDRGDLPPSVVQLLEALEEHGWRPRVVVSGRSLRLWPDNERRRQISVDLYYPVNGHKLDFIRGHTDVDLQVDVDDEDEGEG